MKFTNKYLIHFHRRFTSNFNYLADLSGLIISWLCFIHCWTLPVMLILLPGLMQYNEMAHPVFCTIAIASSAPMLFTKKFSTQSIIFQCALLSGNALMLIILLFHDHLFFSSELIINTTGGFCLVYVHSHNLKIKSETWQGGK